MLNSYKIKDGKQYNLAFRAQEYQVNFIIECYQLFTQLKVISGNEHDVTERMRFIKAFQITLNGVLLLWEFLKEKTFSFCLLSV